MNKIITAGCVAVAAVAAVAMPNKTELEAAKLVVGKMTNAELAEYKAGKKTARDVADAHISLAEKAEKQAEKYLLYQGAFKLYARCEEYDLAADAIQAMKRDVKDIPPEVIAELVSDELRDVPKDRIPRLVAMLNEAVGGKSTADEADEKLYLEVIAELRRKGGSGKERADIVLSKLFPGWTVVAGERIGDMGGFTAGHRGKNNVFCSHPISRERPMILSREVKLPVKNPCLYLAVSSFDKGSDSLLTVRVNGKEALPARCINTPDRAPWEDVVVPLSSWGGQTVKIEIVNNANNWWCEHLFLSRIEISEGRDDARVVEGKATIDGYTWSYRVVNGEATIVAEKDGKCSCAVSPCPKGHLEIPATIEGAKVTSIGEHACFGCGELTSVSIPPSVKHIYNGAFYYCSAMTSFTIPSSATDIESTAFVALHSAKSFSVASDNPSYSSRKGLLCSKDGSILVAGVNGDVTIPQGVVTIGRQSFLGRGLNMTVTIPPSVTKIEERAFAYCFGLTSVTMCGERPEAPDNVFNNCGQLTAIHVPANSKSWAGMKEWQGKPLVFDAK